MSLVCVRHWSRQWCRIRSRGYAATSSAPTTREEKNEGPMFQYFGKHQKANHKVYVWGFSYTGALGIPSFVVPDTGRKKPRKYQLTPYRLETEHQITSAACGYGFTVLSSNTKDLAKVWGMGLNKDSQLGFQRTQHDRHKSYDYVLEPSPVALPLDKPQKTRVVQVACGRAHSLILTDSEGGLGHLDMSATPLPVRGDLTGVKVTQVTTYGDCSLAVSAEGQLYGWGNSEYLQLACVTEATQISSPRLLPLKGVGKVTQAACGGTQVAILNEQGEVFVWGYGILGKGPNLSESQTPELVPPTLFGRSEFNPTVTLSSIRCGLNHFAAVTDQGELFVWGKNVRGCLGIGKHDDQYFPWRVTVPGHVVDVVCGVDHMVALVKSLV
ncbi:RCC1-like G exchanging factor-like protein isoform X2 [Osmerus eperlanus]|uniref:RCC1-like G exchanging factor-like protein isoform X2 n=1 Tax=Osmerus eperlanus TaxID=29151 RepID=UPI002E0D393C